MTIFGLWGHCAAKKTRVDIRRIGRIGGVIVGCLLALSSVVFAGTVTIESPADGSSVNSPVHVHATYNATAKYMKVWVDHVASTVQLSTNTFDSFVSLANGAHLIEVQAQDASTLQIFTSASNITVTTLAVNPPSTSLPPGGSQQFTASDNGAARLRGRRPGERLPIPVSTQRVQASEVS